MYKKNSCSNENTLKCKVFRSFYASVLTVLVNTISLDTILSRKVMQIYRVYDCITFPLNIILALQLWSWIMLTCFVSYVILMREAQLRGVRGVMERRKVEHPPRLATPNKGDKRDN